MTTKISTLKYLCLALGIATATASCSRDKDTIPVIPPSGGTEMKLNGGVGGSSAANSVFVDLSAEKQDSSKRTSWNLGFYSGSQFRVILNSTNGSSAIALNKTDLNGVSATDIDVNDLAIRLGEPGAFSNIDDVGGNLSKTLIAEIATTDSDNKIYIVNPKGGSHADALTPENLFKIRVLRDGGDYQLQYARLNATSFETLTIKKDDDYNFKYISFQNGPVTVEPKKTDWDFQWTWSIYFGGSGASAYPYGFSDLIFINHLAGGVTAAEVIFENDGSTVKPQYEDFTAAHLSSITFSNERNIIGSSWRVTSPSPSDPAPLGRRTDRYYIIRDATGNTYKLRFNAMGSGNDSGTRGYPELEYQLVK